MSLEGERRGYVREVGRSSSSCGQNWRHCLTFDGTSTKNILSKEKESRFKIPFISFDRRDDERR
jgi:hypothetical protein